MTSRLQNVDFELQFRVRDYELDRFDMVNNAVYQNYLEHTRHCFLEVCGVELSELKQLGYSPVVTKVEIAYKSSLRAGDHFISRLKLKEMKRVKFIFEQILYRPTDHRIVLEATVTGTVISRSGKPEIPINFRKSLQSYDGTLLSDGFRAMEY